MVALKHQPINNSVVLCGKKAVGALYTISRVARRRNKILSWILRWIPSSPKSSAYNSGGPKPPEAPYRPKPDVNVLAAQKITALSEPLSGSTKALLSGAVS